MGLSLICSEACRKNTAEYNGVYQVALRDASIKSERARVGVFRAVLLVVVGTGE
jgi:hypothetical protein